MSRLRKYLTWIREGRAFGFKGYFEWGSWIFPASYNWITITPIKLEIEYEKAAPQWNLEVMFMGVGFYLSVAMPWETEQSRDLAERVRDFENDPTFGGRVNYHPDAARELREVGVDIPPFTNPPFTNPPIDVTPSDVSDPKEEKDE